MSIELVMLSSYLILCHPHLLLPSIFTSIKVFSSESALCIRWPRNWSFRFSISPSKVDFLFMSLFRTDWLDLLAVQGTRGIILFENLHTLAGAGAYAPTYDGLGRLRARDRLGEKNTVKAVSSCEMI